MKSITLLRGEHIQSFLESKISNNAINLTSYRTYAAALQKFEQALNRYAEQGHTGEVYAFSESIKNTQEDAGAILKTGGEARAYSNPRALIEKIEMADFRLAATIQYEGGNRVREVGHIREHQLGGIETLRDRGEVGRIDLTRGNTKGGKERSVYVSKETYSALKARIEADKNKEFRVVDQDRYRDVLKKAATDSGQKYNGSHGLRWNYAQESMDRYQKRGASYEQALSSVSKDMGHVRPDITEHYLK
ncbi:MAG: site-specific integrase [Desulfobacter sp.]|nr:site-specific integrase [Desulfobacter sp.]